MKSQFARIKNRASSVSTRALAVMLCFVMLLTAVGAGTMMTAIAAGGAASPVTDAAQKVIDIADSVDVSAAEAAEDEAPTETVFDKLKQQLSELASANADDEAPAPKKKKVELAETGYSKVNVYTSSSKNGTYTKATDFSGNAGSFKLTLTDNQTIYFYLQGDSNSNYFGGDWTLPYNSTYNMGQYYSTSEVKKITFVATNGGGEYTFTVTDVTSGGGSIKATGGDGSGSGGSGSGSGSSEADGSTTATTASKGTAPTRVIAGMDIMFYICGHDGQNDLVNSSSAKPTGDASDKDDTTSSTKYYSAGDISGGDDYVQVTPSFLSSFNRISNNSSGGWNGYNNQSTNISNATGGELFWDKGSDNNGKTDKTSCATTVTPTSIRQGETTTFKTTCGKTKMSHGDQDLYYQYYLDGTKLSVASGKDSIAGSTSEQSFVLSSTITSSLSVGTHTLKTVATDGKVFYVSDTDTFTVTAAEVFHPVTFNVDPSGAGTVNLATGTEVGEETSQTITATPAAGYQFSSWTFGTGITGASTSNASTTITTKSSGTYTVTANFTKASYKLSYNQSTGGTFTVTKDSDGSNIASGSNVEYQTPFTVTCTPNTGYYVKTITRTGISYNNPGNTKSFTMIAQDCTVSVTFAKSNLSISSKSTDPAGKGTVKVAKSSSGSDTSTYQIGNTLYLSVTGLDAAYTVSGYTVTYSDGYVQTISGSTGNTGEIDATHFGTNGAISVVANLTKKPTYKVTVRSSSLAYGTATASVTEAYQGQSVKLTATENTGTFEKWVVTSGTVSNVNNSTTNPLTFTMGSSDLVITANFTEYSGTSNYYYNGYNKSTGAQVQYASRFTKAKVNGQEYSYYKVSGRTDVDQLFTVSLGKLDYEGKAYVGFQAPTNWGVGNWYGSDDEQYIRFFASDGRSIKDFTKMSHDSYLDDNSNSKRGYSAVIPDGARWVQVKYGAGNMYSEWFNLNTKAYDEGGNGGVNSFYLQGSNQKNGNDYKIYGFDHDFGSGKINHIGDVYEYFNENNTFGDNTGVYVNAYSTVGFNTINDFKMDVGGTRADVDHKVCYPNNDMSSYGDYYILVLEPNTSYTINGVTRTTGSNIEVIWQKDLPSKIDDNTPTVDIYAKNGMLRDNTFNRFTNLANTDFDDTYFEYTETLDSGVYTYTSIEDYNASGLHDPIVVTNDVGAYNSTYAKMTNVPVGAKIKIKTTLSDDSTKAGSFTNASGEAQAFRDTHYLKAYTYNGVTYEVHDANNTGVYDEIWTVRDVNTKKTVGETTTNLTKDGRAIEVTPIYYMKDTTNVKTFYIDGYDETVQSRWGNLLSVYPYYEGKSNSANAFGGYPGQPMLFWGGKYQMQIPLTENGTASGATVKGLTLHNAYWDLLHRELDVQCNTSSHCQTYDYDDFYKLNKEKNPDTIIFDFKYRTTWDNFGDGYDYTNYTFGGTKGTTTATAATYAGSGYNGVELLTDYFGRQVDVFGTLIKDDDKSDYDATHPQDKELLIVSTGYKDTYVGEYATMWAVYAPSSGIPSGSGDNANAFIGYIAPSMLYLNDIDRVNKYTGGTQTSSGRMSWSEFIETYNHLKTYYKGVPALISYDKEIWNDSKDKAYRSDGKWYYSNKDDQISANIKVQYCDTDSLVVTKPDKALNDAVWTDDAFTGTGLGGQTNVADHSACSAYFTNITPYLKGKTDSDVQFADSDKNFTFEAVPSGQYMFVNWVRFSNGKYYEVSEKEVAESPMSSNDTYIARFVKTTSGTLKISHVVETNGTYTGSGTPSVTVTVTNGTTQVFSETSEDGTPIDISRFMHTKYAAYKIDISLSTTPNEDCTLHDITNGSGITMYNPGTLSGNAATVAQFTVLDALEGANAVNTLRYVSHLSTIKYTYNYTITYTYTSRFWGAQSYTVTGSLVSTDDEQMTALTGSKGSAKLTTEFLYKKTPYEKNFRQKIAWNHAGATQSSVLKTGTTTTYEITAAVGSTNTVDDRVTAEFMLPYKYDTKANGYKAVKADQYASADTSAAKSGTDYIYDDKSYESVSITSQAFKLFTYDGSEQVGSSSSHATSMPLIEAAPYVIKNATVHRNMTYKKRYLNAGVVTENGKNYYYFTYSGIRYFYKELPPNPFETDVALTESNTVSYYKTDDSGNNVAYTYGYALPRNTVDGGTKYYDNEDNNEARDAVYYWDFGTGDKGQYCVTHEHYEDDGIVANTGTKYYFTRWDIYTSSGSYVASTYLRYFNYSGYENYTIIPIYESTSPSVDEHHETGAHLVPTISFLGDTRNQWNNNGGGEYGAEKGDKMLTDFAISFDYYPEEIAKIPNASNNGKDIRIGMMIEQLGELDVSGTKKITDPTYYADKYKDSITAEKIAQIQTALGNSQNPKSITGANAVVNVKIASNVGTWGTPFDSTSGNLGNSHTGLPPIDNKNRLQWYYTFNNFYTSGTNDGQPTPDRNYVYRASAYIIEINGGVKTVKMSTTPAYFTLYDIASRQLGELI